MDLATLMFISYRAMDERVIGEMQRAGFAITAAQARLAQRIGDDGSRLTELADQAQVTKQTASVLVAGLEEKGFVERVPDPRDGRARIIRFTPAGRAAVRRAQRIVLRVEREWEEHLGPGLAASLREGLTRLRELTDPYR